MIIPEFQTKQEEIDYVVANKTKLIAQKKACIKEADGVPFTYKTVKNEQVTKSVGESSDAIKVTVVINTTNLLDSHGDVHIPSLWNKSYKENKNPMHVQEHNISFKNMISDGDDLLVKIIDISWRELGFNYTGLTQALVFDSTVRMNRNKFMFDQYRNGWVKQHSVGMYYVKLFLCVNNPDYKEEYANWNTYYPMVANYEDADERGYFWAVTEAKYVEGSAVSRGSNFATPTMSVEDIKPEDQEHKNINEPTQATQQEPLESTQRLKYLLDNFTLKI